MSFELTAPFSPSGDQPAAINTLLEGIKQKKKDQVLLGVTGSGKTFTMANIIQETKRPALILAHNKTLAAQLYHEMKEFFPNNAVEYFVSYYDYYQPEAYIPRTDTFIEKDSSINEQIDLMRHSATRALLEREDVIVVASVSCIYGLGSPELYSKMVLFLKKGEHINREEVLQRLIELQYTRNDIGFDRGNFRVRGDSVDIFPVHFSDKAWRLSFFGDELETIHEIDSLTGKKSNELKQVVIYAGSHFVTPKDILQGAVKEVKKDLKERLAQLNELNKLVEAQRLEQRTQFDIEMMVETGSCKGIENYSRYLTGRAPGEPPPTLFEYLPENALLFVDESHVTVPQIQGMYNGDRSRKVNLMEYGFRLPSALDNRPLMFDEWDTMRPQTVFVSATPGPFELNQTEGEVVEQVLRPTGLLDPVCIVRPVEDQVDNLLTECKLCVEKKQRVLVTTLTKKMAEQLADYLQDIGIRVTYLHSDVQTLERIEIIQSLRRGDIDVLVGVNLLREGLDIPECSLVAILDADKEGFLRSETALVQTIGRAARHVEGRVLLYADVMTKSLTRAIDETNRRRAIQQAYNEKHNITPTGVSRKIHETESNGKITQEEEITTPTLTGKALQKHIAALQKKMLNHAADLEFEKATALRNEIQQLEQQEMGLAVS